MKLLADLMPLNHGAVLILSGCGKGRRSTQAPQYTGTMNTLTRTIILSLIRPQLSRF